MRGCSPRGAAHRGPPAISGRPPDPPGGNFGHRRPLSHTCRRLWQSAPDERGDVGTLATAPLAERASVPAVMDRYGDALISVVLACWAAALRIPGLDPSSLWLDDAWVAFVHRVDAPGDIFAVGVTAPGFAFLLKGVFAVVGFSELAAQALPFLAGVAAPPVVFLLARRLGLGRAGALFAGALVTLAPHHVHYSATVKQFTLDALAVLAVMWLALRVVQGHSQGRSRWAILLVGAVAATVLSASVVPAVAAALCAAAVPSLRRRRWPELAWPAAYVVFLALWAPLIRGNVTASLTGYWEDQIADSPGDAIVGVLHVFSMLVGNRLVLGAIVLLIIFVMSLRPASAEVRILLAGPLALAAAATVADVPLGTGRTDLYLYGPLAIGLGWALEWLLPNTGLRVLGVVAAITVAAPWPVADYPEQDVRPLVDAAVEQLRDDDVILTLGSNNALALHAPWPVSLERNERSIHGWHIEHHGPEVRGLRDVLDQEEFLSGFPALTEERVFLLQGQARGGQMAWAEAELEEQGYVAVSRETRPGASLTVWTRSPA